MKNFTLFGKEPALWMALFSSTVMVVSSFLFPLTPDQQGLLNAGCTALFGLLTAYFVDQGAMSAALLGFVKSVLALGVGFGLQLAPEKQAVLLAAVSAVSAMFIRTQVTPVGSPLALRKRAAYAGLPLVPIALLCCVSLGFVSCTSDQVAKVDPMITNSSVGTVGTDLNTAAQQALADYAKVKTNGVDYIWGLQEAFNAYGTIIKTQADVKALVAAWDGTKNDNLADRLATLFGASTGTTADRMATLARAATNTALAFTKS